MPRAVAPLAFQHVSLRAAALRAVAGLTLQPVSLRAGQRGAVASVALQDVSGGATLSERYALPISFDGSFGTRLARLHDPRWVRREPGCDKVNGHAITVADEVGIDLTDFGSLKDNAVLGSRLVMLR